MSTLITDSNELTHFTAGFSQTRPRRRPSAPAQLHRSRSPRRPPPSLGEPVIADTWMPEHTTDDELGDTHYQGDTPEYLVPIDLQEDLQCDSCQ